MGNTVRTTRHGDVFTTEQTAMASSATLATSVGMSRLVVADARAAHHRPPSHIRVAAAAADRSVPSLLRAESATDPWMDPPDGGVHTRPGCTSRSGSTGSHRAQPSQVVCLEIALLQ